MLPEEYARLLGYPRGCVLEGPRARIGGLGARLVREEWPAVVLCAAGRRVFEICMDDSICIDGVHFISKRLKSTLQQAEAHSVILVAVGAGAEAEEEARRRWEEEKPDEYFFLEMYGFRGRGAFDHDRRRAALRLGGAAWHGGVAALQPRLSGVGCCGAAATAGTDEADA